MGRWIRNAAAAIAGIVVAIACAEGIAAVAHDRAFPYLTIFVADDALGVRLAPDASARIRSRDGRVTTVTTGRDGLRVASPSHGHARRVLVLGDSQAMGLHVEDDEALASVLAREHAIEASSAAVPTWGPAESIAVIDELAPARHATHALWILNVANDWHEAFVPNARRTTARDGWAVRPGGPEPREFPGRSILVRSHLGYAVRRGLGHARGVAPVRADAPHQIVADLGWLARPRDPSFRSRLGPTIRDARDACARHGVELVVAVLPLDVQVHAREWAKYREPPLDMRATERLNESALADARELGVRAIDLLPVLRAASPGAFLPDDPHLSPAGHAAIAAATAHLFDAERMEARR